MFKLISYRPKLVETEALVYVFSSRKQDLIQLNFKCFPPSEQHTVLKMLKSAEASQVNDVGKRYQRFLLYSLLATIFCRPLVR